MSKSKRSKKLSRRDNSAFDMPPPPGLIVIPVELDVEFLEMAVAGAVLDVQRARPEHRDPVSGRPSHDVLREWLTKLVAIGNPRESARGRALLRELTKITPRWK